MTALVTGGAGFIGQHLVAALVQRGEAVRVLDIDPREPDRGGSLPAQVELVRGSVTDRKTVRNALKGAERLFHLAGIPDLWTRRKADFETVHLGGTRLVLEEAERACVERIVFTSTESILCDGRPNRRGDPTDESAECGLEDMVGPYCQSKFLAEQEALAAASRGLPLVVVNPTLPVGPGDHRLTPPTRMLLGFLNGRYPAYLDCGLNMIDVRDVALGHLLAAERGRSGERYILGHTNIRLGGLLRRLEMLSGAAMPKLKVPYPVAYATALLSELLADHVTKRAPSAPLAGVRLARHPMRFQAAKAVRELGLAPRPLEESLADAIAWLALHGLIRRPLPKLSGRPNPRPAPLEKPPVLGEAIAASCRNARLSTQ